MCSSVTFSLSINSTALTKFEPLSVELFRKIVNTISGSPVLLKALRDKQNNPNLSFQFELPSSDDHGMPPDHHEESDEELSEMQSADTSMSQIMSFCIGV